MNGSGTASTNAAAGIRAPTSTPAITRTASDTDGDPIEYAHDLFRGDRTRLVVRSGDGAAGDGAAGGRAQVVELRKAVG